MIRVIMPAHLRDLAKVEGEVMLEVEGQASVSTVLTSLEEHYPMLRGTIRDQVTLQRRPFIRFFACGEDLSQDSPDNPLPVGVVNGTHVLRIVGAMAGG
jgi:molybdopterin converting factor small subunit